MPHPSLYFAASALLVLTACGSDNGDTAETDTGVSIAIDRDGDGRTAGIEPGKFELKLPGGIEAKVNLPEGVGDDSKFDINGVGLFPGAKVRSIDIDAADARKTKTAIIKIGFSAPGDAAAVTDWYQKQFDDRDIKVSRSGETLSGTTEDGDPFTLAMEGAGTGASKGELTITDAKSG